MPDAADQINKTIALVVEMLTIAGIFYVPNKRNGQNVDEIAKKVIESEKNNSTG